jgi:hypothetical protein
MARDHGLSPEAHAWMKSVIEAGFAEDKVVLEAIQRRIDTDAFPEIAKEFSVGADRSGLMARRQAQLLIDAERTAGE